MFKPDDLTSRNYRSVLERTHEVNKWGGGGKSHVVDVIEFADQLSAVTVLDYGCGRGTLKPALREMDSRLAECREYDPGIPAKAGMPEQADLVVATDVLEHIEPELVTNVLRHIRALSLRGAFFVIALSKAKLVLTDGKNAHLSIHDADWWIVALEQADFTVVRREKRKGLYVWCKPRE